MIMNKKNNKEEESNESALLSQYHSEGATEEPIHKVPISLVGLSIIFLICGLIAVGPFQWGDIKLPETSKVIYKISIPFVFLIITALLYHHERYNKYWRVMFTFFIGSFSFFLVWLAFRFFSLPTTIEGFALSKLLESLIMVVPIIILILVSGRNLESIYLKKGNLKLGLLIGLTGFICFFLFSIIGAELLFYGTKLTWEKVLLWLPWILMFVLSNGLLEEILYRGLYFKEFKTHVGIYGSILLTALIYSLMHFGVEYTSEDVLFLIITFLLGAFIWHFHTKNR